jgi:hypothetical protein
LYAGQIIFFKYLTTVFVQIFTELIQLFLREKNRQQLVGALADLAADLVKWKVLPEFFEGNSPGFGMQTDGIDDGAVNVEYHGL